MKVEYGSRKIEKQMSSASEIKKAFGKNAVRVSQRLDEMRSAVRLAGLQQIPAANCHPLKGNRAGEWSVDISANFRIIFTPNHSPLPRKENGEIDTSQITIIKIIETTDYH